MSETSLVPLNHRYAAFLQPRIASVRMKRTAPHSATFARPADDAVPAESHDAKPLRVGVISNPRSHHNQDNSFGAVADTPGLDFAVPKTKDELREALGRFARNAVDLIVIDGGDGTIRDVVTAARSVFQTHMPRVALLPSGKTNALALDLGIDTNISLQDVLDAARADRIVARAPMEITRAGSQSPDMLGFLFGAGAFVRATELAQRTHKAGAFNGFAVGLSLIWCIAQTLFGSAANRWRMGDRMRMRLNMDEAGERLLYVFLASTLERLPLRLRPFGKSRSGFKLLAVDAPPRRLFSTLPGLLGGSEAEAIAKAGYHRHTPQAVAIDFDGEFVLDGEVFPAGEMTIRAGEPLHFIVP